MDYDNFAGVRIDGSNATIVGRQPGEFKADRTNIPRVWMDRGAWPLLTVKLYLDQTGDLGFLLREQTYFKDHVAHRCRQVDADWRPDQGTVVRTAAGDPHHDRFCGLRQTTGQARPAVRLLRLCPPHRNR